MVKLTGPHFSITALGKFGKVTVYAIWKGIQYARMLVTPTNPQSGAQGDRRNILGGLGRSAKYIQTDSDFEGYAKAVAPAGQSWISYYIKYIMTNYFASVANFTTHHEEEEAHDSHAIFGEHAAIIGLDHYAVAYRDMPIQFTNNHQLYCVAKFGCDQYLADNTKFNVAPYTKALATWVEADIVLMVADFSA